jgi:hypothetical protein
MKRLLLALALSGLCLVACAPFPRPPGPEPAASTPTPVPAQSSATETPTWTPTPTPAPTPTAPLLEPAEEGYEIAEERQIDEYVVRLWRKPSDGAFPYEGIATISSKHGVEARIEMASELGTETGTDLTGEGHPDAVVRVFTGGAHCCFSTVVYDLGPTLIKVLETPLSNCNGSFEDLDGDGVTEFLTCDDLFAYVYCAYAGSPAVQVVLRYAPGDGYVPASPVFADLYTEAIAQHAQQAESAQPGAMGEWDGSTKCSVLPLVLDYLYSGQDGRAWAELDRLYNRADALLFWAEIVRAIRDSPLYAPSEAPVDVPLPPHYMLQLHPACGPGEMQQAVRVISEGQTADGAPCRDLYWLQAQLLRAGILAEGEMLVLAPEGCTDVCRLDVIRTSDNASAGGIRLDTENGFPGVVYRVDGPTGGPGERWRMRGDLTWERVPR